MTPLLGDVVIASGTTDKLAQGSLFSSATSIRDHADRRTLGRLESVLRATGAPARVPEPTKAFVCSDPMVRNIVAALATRLEAQAELDADATETAVALVRALGTYHCTGQFPGGLALGSALPSVCATGGTRAISLWQTQTAPDQLVANFTARLAGKVPGSQSFADFTVPQIATLESALRLLSSTIPAVAASMVPHVQLLCRLATPPDTTDIILSSSFRDISGVVFLADPTLVSPLLAAEHILHEACHQRYGEISHSASILAGGYDDDFSAKIVVPWHRPSAESSVWSTDKALTAAHVYLYLAYFYGMLHDAPVDRPAGEMEELRRRMFSKCDRGRFLLTALDATGRTQLGYAGNLMLDWMRDMFATFAVEDNHRARLTRLVLERYVEEEVEFRLHAGALARRDFSADGERFSAFMAWLDSLEPSASQRFEKLLTGTPARSAGADDQDTLPGLRRPAHAPLERYYLARRERARTVRDLLALAPGELARHTDQRAALTFAQAESVNLDNFVDPRFRDRLVRQRALQRAVT